MLVREDEGLEQLSITGLLTIHRAMTVKTFGQVQIDADVTIGSLRLYSDKHTEYI